MAGISAIHRLRYPTSLMVVSGTTKRYCRLPVRFQRCIDRRRLMRRSDRFSGSPSRQKCQTRSRRPSSQPPPIHHIGSQRWLNPVRRLVAFRGLSLVIGLEHHSEAETLAPITAGILVVVLPRSTQRRRYIDSKSYMCLGQSRISAG